MMKGYQQSRPVVKHFCKKRKEFAQAMRQLGVFAKYWQPGGVKTRLAASIGQRAAARFHRECVRTILARTRTLAVHRVLMVDPPVRLAEFTEFAGNDWNVLPQSAGDLGARMRQYFDTAFAGGAAQVVLIGSDSPTLPLEYIERAFDRLSRRAVVLGPANDGGYYLLAARRAAPPIFDGVEWGSDRVLRETVERLNAAGCSYCELPPWYDVDTIDDLRRLRAELASMEPRPNEFAALWREIQGLR
jgi:rSAM/selenodomain-associated transferase 1